MYSTNTAGQSTNVTYTDARSFFIKKEFQMYISVLTQSTCTKDLFFKRLNRFHKVEDFIWLWGSEGSFKEADECFIFKNFN